MQINLPLLNMTGCWTITAEGTQSFMRSFKSRLRWQRGMCALSGECWSRDTRLRFVMPMAGRCFTSLQPKEKSDACGCSWSMEVSGFYLFRILLLKVPLEGSILLVNSVCEVLFGFLIPKRTCFWTFSTIRPPFSFLTVYLFISNYPCLTLPSTKTLESCMIHLKVV